MDKSKIFWILLVVLIIASFLRLYQFTSTPPGLYPDEAADGNNALEVTHTGHFQAFYPEDNGREGLYVNIVALLIKFTGGIHEPWIIRLPAAISGILTVLGIYFLAAELFGPEVGLLSAFLLATNFWHINFSRIGFRAIMAPLFLVWSLYLLIKGFKKLQNGIPFIRTAALHLVGAILFGLGMYTYIAYRVSPALVLLVFLFYWFIARKGNWQKTFFLSAAKFTLVSLIVFVPLGYYFYSHPGSFFGRTSQISVSNSGRPLQDLALNTVKTLAMFNVHGDWNWRHNISGAPELFWPVGILFLIGLVLGVASIIKKLRGRYEKDRNNPFAFLLLFAWFFLAMLPVVISDEGIPHALRSILMIPPVIVFAAFGGYAAYEWLRKHVRPSPLRTLTAVFIALLAFQAYTSYFVTWATNSNVPDAFNANYVTLGQELNALPSETPKYVVVEAGGVPIRGIPTTAQTTMFITDTFRAEEQSLKHIFYILPQDKNTIPAGALTFYIR